MVLRLAQPSNTALALRVETGLPVLARDSASFAPRLVTAVESAANPNDEVEAQVAGDAGRFDLFSRRALSTVVIAPRD